MVLTKWYFSGGVCKSKAQLDGKIHNGLKVAFQFFLLTEAHSYTEGDIGGF